MHEEPPTPLQTLRTIITTRVLKHATHDAPIVTKSLESSSWIFDFREALGDPVFLAAYADVFWEKFTDAMPMQICGIESSGIALVTAIILRGRERGKDVNGVYVRKSRNKHGLMKSIEGPVRNVRTIFVDDVINSGQSLDRSIHVLRAARLDVTDVFMILALRDDAAYDAARDGAALHTLFRGNDFGIALPPAARETPKYEIIWRFAGGRASFQHVLPKSGITADGNFLFFGSDTGVLNAVRARDGSLAWRYRVGYAHGKGIFSTPALWANTVYFGAYDGNVYALDATSGEKRWIYRDADWVGSSPSISPSLGLIFIGLEYGLWNKHGGIAALSLSDGSEVWAHKTMSDFTHSSPLYIEEERKLVIGNNNGLVYGLEALSGEPKWQFATKGSVRGSFAFDPVKRRIIFGSFDGLVYALDTSGKLAWSFDTGEAIFATPCVGLDTIFIPSLNKYLFALDAKTGAERWRFATRGRIFSSPILSGGSVWFGSNDGRLYELDPLNGSLRSFFQTGDRIVNAVCMDNAGHIFVPTDANEVYCIQRKDA